jgi:hypothetical protein
MQLVVRVFGSPGSQVSIGPLPPFNKSTIPFGQVFGETHSSLKQISLTSQLRLPHDTPPAFPVIPTFPPKKPFSHPHNPPSAESPAALAKATNPTVNITETAMQRNTFLLDFTDIFTLFR